MHVLSKKQQRSAEEISVTVTIDTDSQEQVEDRKLDGALDAFAEHVEELGYTDFDVSFIAHPYVTNRGILLAEGSFIGPNPFEHESRAPEDRDTFSFIVVEDEDVDVILIEVKHESARLASFKILGDGIEPLDGELPHV